MPTLEKCFERKKSPFPISLRSAVGKKEKEEEVGAGYHDSSYHGSKHYKGTCDGIWE